MPRLQSVLLRLGVGAMLSATLLARADVLVLKDGRLLLGDIRSVNGNKMELGLGGGAGNTIISATSVQMSIACPAAERPDTYLKAARRAQQQGLLHEAALCYGKSIETEAATAASAQLELAALRREMTARATSRVNNNARGQPPRPGALEVKTQAVGPTNPPALVTLARLDDPKPAEGVTAVAHTVTASNQTPDWWGQNWQWIVAALLALILLLRLIHRSYFG